MSDVRELETRAVRLATIHGGAGQRTMPAEMAADALEATKGMYQGCIGNGLFGPVTDVLITADYTAGENERIINNSDDNWSITLPLTITECGVERPPEDRSFVIIADAEAPAYFIYDADVADWQQIETLTLDSYAPLSGRWPTHLAALLAVHLLSEYGMEPSEMLVSLATTARAVLRLKKPRPVSVPNTLLRGVGRGFR